MPAPDYHVFATDHDEALLQRVGRAVATSADNDKAARLGILASVADVNAPAANAAAVVTYAAAGTTVAHLLGGIAYSYSATPTAGNLKVEDGSGNVVFSVDVAVAGEKNITFPSAKRGTPNAALIVTLAAGGSGVVGKLSITSHGTYDSAA